MKRVFLLVIMMAGTLASAKAQLSVGTNPTVPVLPNRPMNLQIRADDGQVTSVDKKNGALKVDGSSHLVGPVTVSDTIRTIGIEASKGLKVIGGSHLVGKVTASDELEVQKFLTAKGGVVISPVPNNNSLTVDGPSHLKQGVKVDGLVSATLLKVTNGAQDGYILRSDKDGVASWSAFSDNRGNVQTSDIWVYGVIDKTTYQWIGSGGKTDGSAGQYTVVLFKELEDAFGSYEPSSGTITIPSDGIFQMSAAVRKSTPSTANIFNMGFCVIVKRNGVEFVHSRFFHDGFQPLSAMPLASGAGTFALKKGDLVQFALFSSYGEYGIGGVGNNDPDNTKKTVDGEGYFSFIKLSNYPK